MKGSPKLHPKQPSSPLRLALGGMLAALVLVSTLFLKLPLPMAHGYVHLGDGVILLGALALGWPAVPAAAIGSLLADLWLGYVPYALPSFLIKGGVAALALMGRGWPLWVRALWLLLAEVVMVAGYFLVEWLVLGYGLAAAAAGVAGNCLQGASGVVLALALHPILARLQLPRG